MTDREKLIELLEDTRANADWRHWGYEEFADHLIAHGVTVQEWISVKDRLPKRGEKVLCYMNFSDVPELGFSEIIITDNVYNGILVGSNPRKPVWEWQGDYVTHWMPLPQPPKGE